MPFIPNTPESNIARTDSKNPSQTCRGLTAAGRPCRRPISASASHSALSHIRRSTIPSPATPDSFCWQHKDQAIPSGSDPSQRASAVQRATIRERSSVDTLVDRLGILDIDDEQSKRPKTQKSQYTGLDEKERVRRDAQSRPKVVRRIGFWESLLCCLSDPRSNPGATHPRPRPVKTIHSHAVAPTTLSPALPSSPTSKALLRLIPRTLPPATISMLLNELSKPVSESDEAGYIYIFWLTPESLPAHEPSEAAQRLLEVPDASKRPGAGRRKTSDVLKDFAAADYSEKSNNMGAQDRKTILLKIGRANNVQRRLNEWRRQCGYNLSLIRYYPYSPSQPSSSSTSSPSRPQSKAASSKRPHPPHTVSEPIKVPHAHKVERLIHIELATLKAREEDVCKTCGRGHREWFEVAADREGVRKVDEVVRRWVDWGLKNPAGM